MMGEKVKECQGSVEDIESKVVLGNMHSISPESKTEEE
jgi:hypothetical protein